MPTVVSVVVSDPGDALTLATVRAVTWDSCDNVSAGEMVNGKSVGQNIQCQPGKTPAFIEYAVSRNAAALEEVVDTHFVG